jgi:CrcB protein
MIWSVAIGGAMGSVARFLLSGLIQRSSGTIFPIWTLVINVTGSLLLGFLMRYLIDGVSVSAEMRVLLTAGFCGGYTTFSTFSYETVSLIEQGDWGRSALYVTLSVVLSILGTFAGVAIAKELIARLRGA